MVLKRKVSNVKMNKVPDVKIVTIFRLSNIVSNSSPPFIMIEMYKMRRTRTFAETMVTK